MHNHAVGPFAGIVHRHGAADAAVAARNNSYFIKQFVSAAIALADVLWLRAHGVLIAGLFLLVLRGLLLVAHVRSLLCVHESLRYLTGRPVSSGSGLSRAFNVDQRRRVGQITRLYSLC